MFKQDSIHDRYTHEYTAHHKGHRLLEVQLHDGGGILRVGVSKPAAIEAQSRGVEGGHFQWRVRQLGQCVCACMCAWVRV